MPGKDQAAIETFIKTFFTTAGDGIKKDGKVKIRWFGQFLIREGDSETIVFIPDKEMSDSVNRPFSCFEAEELDDNVTEAMLDVATDEDIETTSTMQTCEQIMDNGNEPDSDEIENAFDMVIDMTQPDSTHPESTGIHEAENSEPGRQEPPFSDNIPENDQIDIEPEDEIIAHDSDDDTAEPLVIYKNKYWPALVCGLVIGGIIGFCSAYFMFSTKPDITEAEEETVFQTATEITEQKVDEDTVESEMPLTDVATKPSVVTDTVRRDRFLTTMARQYFGAMEFWAYIYIENSDRLGDPDRIAPNTVVVIPPAEKYGINRLDEKSLKDAKQKGSEIYSKYRK